MCVCVCVCVCVSCRRKKTMQGWSEMKVIKWWQNINFWVNYAFRSSWAGRSVFSLHLSLRCLTTCHWPTTHCMCVRVSKLHGVERQPIHGGSVTPEWSVRCEVGGLEKWDWNWHAPLTELWKMTCCSDKLHTAELQWTYELLPLVSDADSLKVSNHN